MPIHHTLELTNISDREFSEIDSVVMECAYATQNRFGRLFDEPIYENDLAASCCEMHSRPRIGTDQRPTWINGGR